MRTTDRKNQAEILHPPVGSGNTPSVLEPQPQDITTNHLEEPKVWRTIGRLLHEANFILFFIGLHWLIKLWLTKTEQLHEWWATYLLTVSIFFALIVFTVVFGSEVIVDCKHALAFAWRRVLNKDE